MGTEIMPRNGQRQGLVFTPNEMTKLSRIISHNINGAQCLHLVGFLEGSRYSVVPEYMLGMCEALGSISRAKKRKEKK